MAQVIHKYLNSTHVVNWSPGRGREARRQMQQGHLKVYWTEWNLAANTFELLD